MYFAVMLFVSTAEYNYCKLSRKYMNVNVVFHSADGHNTVGKGKVVI